jgi:small subunit ribosomal protein S17
MTDSLQPTSQGFGPRKVRVGRVVSDKMNKTIVVEVQRMIKHSLYRKFIRRNKKLYVHDEKREAHEGDVVRVIETRPVSKTKRWRLLQVVERAK